MASRHNQQFPTVLLRHDLPDGSEHIDWMVAQDALGTLPLLTFRLGRRPDELLNGESLPGCRIADHRPAYLELEGPVSGGRGRVTRLARGMVSNWRRDEKTGPERWSMEIHWPTAVQQLEVVRQKLDQWLVFCVTISQAGDKT
jgi:hypothetical protein